MTPTIGHWIDDAVDDSAVETQPVRDPATGQIRAHVVLGDAGTVDRAVQAAARAAATWGALSLARRTQVLFGFRQLLHERRAEIADAIVAEHGKTREDALGEVARGIEVVEFACGSAHLLKGEHSVGVSMSVDTYSIRQPLGVVAGVTPFNFPAMVPLWMVPMALACGNAFVLKPSERDPSASLLLARALRDAGAPPGVFNVVQGGRAAVDALLHHPDVAAVSFVGSTPVARFIYETAGRTGKRVQALGGAKNHAIVMPDADMDSAADAIIGAAYGSAGERCMAISVVVAVADAGDRLVKAVADRLDKLRVGGGGDPETDMGPLITAEHRDRVRDYIAAGAEQGAVLVADGRRHSAPAAGYFVGPTLLDHVSPAMTVYRDEIFGPVLSVVRVDTFDAALALVNANPYGNGAAIFSRDGGTCRAFELGVRAGMVGINVPVPVPVAYYSFGGWKDSLFGDLHVHGPDAVRFYTRTKVVTARWPDHRAVATPPADTAVSPSALAFPTNR